MKKAFLIFIVFGFFVLTGYSAGATGLRTGADAAAIKKNEHISGRIIAINVEKEPFTIILPTGRTLRVEFRNIQKIEDTGTKKKITPSYSYTESNYKIYRFTFTDGKIAEGGVAKWPVFDIDTGTMGIQKDLWLDQLSSIEAGKTVAFVKSSLQTGAKVEYSQDKTTTVGTILAINVEKEPFTIILPTGKTLRVEFKNIQKIEDSGTKKKITPSYSYTESNYKIYRFTFIDGKIAEGGVAKWPVFDIDTGTMGVQKNVWLDHLTSIEAK
ncbi:MAG: hypothetical protein ABFD50_00825 [Smithella sp.]